MRKFFLTAFTLAAVVVLATSAFALEKTSKPLGDVDRGDDWGAQNTVTVRYYNNCTGWVWVWSGWNPGEAMGVCVDNCPHGAVLAATATLTFSPIPSGYGYTGTISIQDKCDCTGNVLQAQPWLPVSGFTIHVWNQNVNTSSFLVNIAWGAPTGLTNSSAIATDHPAAGPTGVQACGACYPLNRAVHSKYFGVGGAYCPGTSLNDGICDVEFNMDIALKCVVSVEDASWGQIKNLYQ
jgi:hypothetical protein